MIDPRLDLQRLIDAKQYLDIAGVMILALDAEGRVTLMNAKGSQILGRKVEEIVGRTWIDTFLPERTRTQLKAVFDQLISGDFQPVEYLENPVLTSEGTERIIAWHNSVIRDEAGHIIGTLSSGEDITERKKAEAALRQSEQKFSAIFHATPIASSLATVPDGTIYDVNEAWLQLNGFTRKEDVVGKTSVELGLIQDVETRERILNEFRRLGSVRNAEILARSKAGVERTFLVDLQMIEIGQRKFILSTNLDITERKKTEALRQALIEQDRLRLGAAVEQASDAVVMFDLDGTIRYVNAGFESINQVPRDQAVGRSYFSFLAGDPAAEAIRKAVDEGRAWHGSVTRPIPDGRTIELEVTLSFAKDSAGTVIGGLATEADVTEKNALQQQIRQAQKMEALGTLAGGITHDFNNILGAIIINTELALLDMDQADRARRPLPIVLQAANRGKELVKQIITFSRQRAWERRPLEIAPIVREGMGLLRSTLPKDITVRETIDDASGIAQADPSHIHQILVNLCQNAALAMRDRGGDLEVELKPVEIDAAMAARYPDLLPGPYIRLTVADTGCGMTSEVVERIFEPFFTTREQGQGSGLGLAVVHGIVKSYDGAITVRSKPGQGSILDIYIPRLGNETLAAASEPPLLPVEGQARILLVEDEEAQRTSLARGLEHLGYRVTTAAEGRSALAAFRKTPEAFDLVVTDQTMPRMSGLDLAAEMMKARPDIPIILCTGFSEKVDDGTFGRMRIRELVMKPFTITEISQLIRKVLMNETGMKP